MKGHSLAGIMLLIGLLVSCASTSKSAYSPEGNWEYKMEETPDGDAFGTFTLVFVEEALTGHLNSREHGKILMEQVRLRKGNAFTCVFFMNDADMTMEGIFEGDTFAGTIDADLLGEFPITANRIVDK